MIVTMGLEHDSKVKKIEISLNEDLIYLNFFYEEEKCVQACLKRSEFFRIKESIDFLGEVNG